MLKLLFRTTIALDWRFATTSQRWAARQRARQARVVYGDDATDHLLMKLRHPQRRRSRRELRLAIGELIGQ